jgi:ATP-dependent helicase/nuclease subunit B
MAARGRFILGRAGAGKTHAVLAEVADELQRQPLGPPIWLITPRQATFQTQRQLLAQPGGSRAQCRVRVVSFDRLAEMLLADEADLPPLSAGARVLLLGDILRREAEHLKIFGQSASQAGTAEAMAVFFEDLDRADRSLDELEQALARDDAEPGMIGRRMRDKFHDVLHVGRRFAQRLKGRIDPLTRRRRAAELAATSPLLRGSIVYVDGFYEVDADQRRLLAGIARAAEAVTVTAVVDPEDGTNPLFAQPAEALEKLRGDLHAVGVIDLAEQRVAPARRFAQGSAVAEVEKLWTMGGRLAGPLVGDGLRLVVANGPAAEVDAAARQVQDWLGRGLRLRDCLVMARDLGPYLPLIEHSFAEHKLPIFVDRRRAGGHHPLVRLVRFALQIATEDWPRDAVVALAKTRLAGLDAAEAHDLEAHARRHRAAGRAAWVDEGPWLDSDEPAPQAERGHALRRQLVDVLTPFADAFAGERVSYAEAADAIVSLLGRCRTGERLAELAADARERSDPLAAEEHEQVWSALHDLLAQAKAVAGDGVAPSADVAASLQTALDGIDVGVIPATLDAVLIGQVDRVRPPPMRAAIVLGLGEGQFPLTESDPPLLGDRERSALRRAGVEIDRDRLDRRDNEPLLAYHAFTRPAEFLTLTRPVQDADGNLLAPGAFWEELAPFAEPERDAPQPATPRQAFVIIADWARGTLPEDQHADAAALYEHALRDERRLADWNLLRAWPALSYRNRPALSREAAAALYGERVRGGPTRFERFGQCPFLHFANDGLKLDDPIGDDITPLDEGNLLHEGLRRLAEACVGKYDFSREVPPDARIATGAERVIGEVIDDIGRRAVRRSRGGSYLRRRLARELAAAFRRELHHWRAGAFRPTKFEQNITGDPEAAKLEGRIDRVDATAGGEVCVVDYKRSSAEPVKPDRVRFGTTLQLPIYLHAAREFGRPVAALHVQLRPKIKLVPHPDEIVVDPLDPRPRGILAQDAGPLFEAGYDERSPSTVVPIAFTKKGEAGKRGNEAVPPAELAELADDAVAKVSAFAASAHAGNVAVRPYREGTKTPCAWCAFRSVCRHEPRLNGYRDASDPKNSAEHADAR